MIITLLFILSCLIISFYILNKKPNGYKSLNLPPGPPKLPIIGNIHQLANGALQHHTLRDLAKKYGPIMHMQLGQMSTIIVSSPHLVQEVLKTNNLALASRPYPLMADIVLYGRTDIGLGPYSDYWRQMKKLVTIEVLSPQKVRSLIGLRHEEIDNFMDFIRSTCEKPFFMNEQIMKLSNNIVCKLLFGNNCKQQDVMIRAAEEVLKMATGFHVADLFPEFGFLSVISGMKSKLTKIHKSLDKILDDIFEERRIKRQTSGASEEDLLDVIFNIKERGDLQIPITDNNIKAIFVNMFIGGTDTTAVTIEWAMTEMMRNPNVMKKAQTEVREAFKGKKTIEEKDLQDLVYLKLIIKETLRFHHPPLLVPRECREHCQIDGYDIPVKTKVIINSFVNATDPEYWDDAKSFKPERFKNSSVDFYGKNYEFVPFGGGRRMCPGISFGLIFIEFTLAQMLYFFDWRLPNGLSPDEVDMTENDGITASKKVPLQVIPTLYSPVS